MEIKKLSLAVAGAAFIALLTGATAPVQAALLDFSFTTESGATGSFTLDTDTPSSSEPGIFGPGVSFFAVSPAL